MELPHNTSHLQSLCRPLASFGERRDAFVITVPHMLSSMWPCFKPEFRSKPKVDALTCNKIEQCGLCAVALDSRCHGPPENFPSAALRFNGDKPWLATFIKKINCTGSLRAKTKMKTRTICEHWVLPSASSCSADGKASPPRLLVFACDSSQVVH